MSDQTAQVVNIDKLERSRLARFVLESQMNRVALSTCPRYPDFAYFQSLVLEGPRGRIDNSEDYKSDICQSYPRGCAGFNI